MARGGWGRAAGAAGAWRQGRGGRSRGERGGDEIRGEGTPGAWRSGSGVGAAVGFLRRAQTCPRPAPICSLRLRGHPPRLRDGAPRPLLRPLVPAQRLPRPRPGRSGAGHPPPAPRPGLPLRSVPSCRPRSAFPQYPVGLPAGAPPSVPAPCHPFLGEPAPPAGPEGNLIPSTSAGKYQHFSTISDPVSWPEARLASLKVRPGGAAPLGHLSWPGGPHGRGDR